MDPKAHPISLDRVFFTRSVVIAIPEFKVGESNFSVFPENKLDVAQVDNEPGRFMATMRTIFNLNGDAALPYTIDMECIGMCNAAHHLTLDEAVKQVTITAHSVLYGAIRESVLWITGRQPFGQVMLGLSVLQNSPSENEKN